MMACDGRLGMMHRHLSVKSIKAVFSPVKAGFVLTERLAMLCSAGSLSVMNGDGVLMKDAI
jgi:hypothetical protein